MSEYAPTTALPKIEGGRIAIATAEWNGHITGPLTEGAVNRLLDYGFEKDDIEVYHVPGTVELTFAASQLIESGRFNAVIVFGCVIRGDTPHFDYVCQSVTQGITSLNADCDIPVIFGVLTVEEEKQAIERLHKGREAAEAAIKMISFLESVNN